MKRNIKIASLHPLQIFARCSVRIKGAQIMDDGLQLIRMREKPGRLQSAVFVTDMYFRNDPVGDKFSLTVNAAAAHQNKQRQKKGSAFAANHENF